MHHLGGAAYGMHFADQVALVSVPLIASLVFGATPETIGVLVACQSMAHLIGSIPFGLLIDQMQLRSLAIASALAVSASFIAASVSIVQGSIFSFGLAVTVAGFGAVLFGLTSLSIVPRAVSPSDLARANAAIEVPRALCSFAVPLLVGLAIGNVPDWIAFSAASCATAAAAAYLWRLPSFSKSPKRSAPVLGQIYDGGKLVARHSLLRPICLCAIFWNFAFAALLVALVPAIQGIYEFDPGSFGIALATFGLGAVLGSWASGWLSAWIAPSLFLMFGPGSSVIAATSLLFIQPPLSAAWLYTSFFLLGFGPSMWLIVQNSIRQIVSPAHMLGRVNAVIQTAIYGVRPLGALVGGMVTGAFGPSTGLAMVVVLYVLSFASSLFSDLRNVTSLQSLETAKA